MLGGSAARWIAFGDEKVRLQHCGRSRGWPGRHAGREPSSSTQRTPLPIANGGNSRKFLADPACLTPFALYTGQDADAGREATHAKAPDILLTDFVMLELAQWSASRRRH